MAVTVEWIPESRDGERLEDGEYRYTRQARVRTDGDLTVSEATVLSAVLATVAPGDAHPVHTNARAVSFRARESEGRAVWVADVGYTTKQPDPALADENPLLRPAKVSRRTETLEAAFEEDEDGFAVVNAAADPFDPPLTREERYWVYTIQRNEATFDSDDMLTYLDTVNEQTWYGHDARLARMLDITQEETWEGSYFYHAVTYVIGVRKLGNADPDYGPWNPSVLNVGYHYLDLTDPFNPVRRMFRERGQPMQSPQPLTLTGEPLAANGTETYLEFRKYPDKDWGPLALP